MRSVYAFLVLMLSTIIGFAQADLEVLPVWTPLQDQLYASDWLVYPVMQKA